jgi:hypothetical protein
VVGLDRPLPTWEEQLLCVGSTFQVAATNGRDPARRVNIQVRASSALVFGSSWGLCNLGTVVEVGLIQVGLAALLQHTILYQVRCWPAAACCCGEDVAMVSA